MTFEEFKKVVSDWHEETKFLSSHAAMEKHSSFDLLKAQDNKDEIISYACLLLEEEIHLMMILIFNLVPAEKMAPHPGEYYSGRIPVIKECLKYWALKENWVTSRHDENGHWVEDKQGNKGNWS